jgi:hypothetical protein
MLLLFRSAKSPVLFARGLAEMFSDSTFTCAFESNECSRSVTKFQGGRLCDNELRMQKWGA